MYISDSDFDEYLEWRHKQAAEAAECERQRKVKQLRQQQHDDFIRNQRIDACLMDGVKAGKTWFQFFRETQCPTDLQSRYLELQKQSGVAPGSVNADEDRFLRGFNHDL